MTNVIVEGVCQFVGVGERLGVEIRNGIGPKHESTHNGTKLTGGSLRWIAEYHYT